MPFAVFRRHQPKLLAVFAILAMFGFVVADSLPRLLSGELRPAGATRRRRPELEVGPPQPASPHAGRAEQREPFMAELSGRLYGRPAPISSAT